MAEYSDSNNFSSDPARRKLIDTAVKFLENPKVVSRTSESKYQFLLNKGLTHDEVKTAFAHASVALPHKTENTVISAPSFKNNSNSSENDGVHNSQVTQQPKWIFTIKEFFNITSFVGMTVYCFYWCYKKFIEPFLFKSKKPEPQPADKTEVILKEVSERMAKIEDKVDKIISDRLSDLPISLLVQEMKTDLTSLKGLLLSRKQFPSAPPSIPTWQLDDTSNQNREKTTEDDAASGSSANNSDSSLEMIREDPK